MHYWPLHGTPVESIAQATMSYVVYPFTTYNYTVYVMKIFYPLLFQHSLLNNFMQKPESHMNLFNFRIEIFRFVYEKPIGPYLTSRRK